MVHVDRPEALDAAISETAPKRRCRRSRRTLLSTRNGLEKEYAEAALKYRLPSMHELEISARLRRSA